MQGDLRQRAGSAAGFTSAARVPVGLPCGSVVGFKTVDTAYVQVLMSTLSLCLSSAKQLSSSSCSRQVSQQRGIEA